MLCNIPNLISPHVAGHVSLAHQHCLSVTSLLSPPSLSSLPTFPLVLGRKPALVTIPGLGNNSLEKENRPPDNLAAGMTESLISKVSSLIYNYPKQHDILTPTYHVHKFPFAR